LGNYSIGANTLADALKGAGVPVILIVLNGVGHGGQEFLKPDKVRIIDAFLREYLSRPSVAKSP